jgi:hypothetical protein
MLKRSSEILGRMLHATDGAIGHAVDFLLDPESWAIRYLLVNTHNWLPGKHVMIAPSLIERVEWPQYAVHLKLSREEVRRSPEYGG